MTLLFSLRGKVIQVGGVTEAKQSQLWCVTLEKQIQNVWSSVFAWQVQSWTVSYGCVIFKCNSRCPLEWWIIVVFFI